MRHHAAVGRASIPRTPRFGPFEVARQQITPRFGPFEVARQTRALRGATPAVPWEPPEFEFGSCYVTIIGLPVLVRNSRPSLFTPVAFLARCLDFIAGVVVVIIGLIV